MAAERHRKGFFKNLHAAIWKKGEDEQRSTFATGGQITPNQDGLILKSLNVDGVGEMRLPVSSDDIARLLGVCEQAPYGHGLETVVNVDVRRAWQVDASKVTFPQSPDFVAKTVSKLANKAVRALGLDGAALQLEPHFYKLLLYEDGGHFNVHRDTEKEPGMFATMVLQLPTERGFEGGALIVRHNGTTKTFDFTVNSSTGIFYTAFYADCEHELQSVVSGQRLCLVFNLVRGRGNDSFNMELGELKGFSAQLARVEAALRPWEVLMTDGASREGASFLTDKLAIPLQHKYTKKNLSFAGLKGVDRVVARVLKNCRDGSGKRWLDLHLCILTLHKTGVAEERDSYHYDRNDSDDSDDDEGPRGQHVMEDVIDEGVECDNWVGSNNRPCNFKVDIDHELEAVIDYDEQDGPFNEDDEADQVDYERYMGNYGPTLQEWYHTAMLVIWPKKKSISMAWAGGVSGALDVLETRAAEGDADIVTMLREVLSHCERELATILTSDLAVSRLLKLCLTVGGLEDVVRVFELLLKPYRHPGRTSVVSIVGIRNAATATAIASVVNRHGWINCGGFIMNMLTKDQAVLHGEYFAQLALELQKLGYEDAALLVAKRTLELIYFPCSNLSQLKAEIIANVGKMIFCIESCLDEVGPSFVDRLVTLGTEMLCWLVVQIYAVLSKEVLRQSSSTQVGLFKRICEFVTTRNFHHPAVSPSHVVNLVRPFFHLGDEQLFNNLIQAFLDQSRVHKEQHFLKEILGSDDIWKDLSGTVLGRSKLQLLAEERIPVLAQPKPPFTWCMPFAKFPPSSSYGSCSDHSAVQAFLRGPEERLEYTGVNDSSHAYNFANKYFNGRYVSGYSAKADVGLLGSKVCVIITKTRTAFKHDVEYWKKGLQLELSSLRQRLDRIHEAGTGRNGSGSGGGGVEIILLSPDASSEREKRRRISTTEYIDLSLDDDE
ncbi:hypothetical protein KC19_11G044100 [Ceratodon purpureus]|uniref:Prolyl 4-hydroxylase alpha subunit Fe(2+) 2OG dioxygenase domain-containing protein n=1 Tax=Ceratodon purpureus TaxID=3225 RepID=A0A8T0GGL8_CERPU|nr:hypothetical protein KC19_11G044100 [Ceratodon purpureus]